MHCDEVTEFLVRQKKKERIFPPTRWWLDRTEGLCFKVTAKILARTAQKSWHLESRNGSAWWRSLRNASDFCLRQPEHCPAAGANALSIKFASLTSGSVLRVSNTRPSRLQTTKTIEFQSSFSLFALLTTAPPDARVIISTRVVTFCSKDEKNPASLLYYLHLLSFC